MKATSRPNTLTRLIVLNLILLGGWGAAALIPTEPELRSAAVIMALPTELEGWTGRPIEPSEEERLLLAEDTEYEKKTYNSPGSPPGETQIDSVLASIVLSGHDLNNSIHRPERCMTSQGFRDLNVEAVTIRRPNGTMFTAHRIKSYRNYTDTEGESIAVPNINYYWFVGHRSITASHYERTLIDMKDRILGGYNQRWAYFSVSANVLENLPGIRHRSAEATDRLLREFVAATYRACVKRAAVSAH